ncbi:MAG: hypothetical protein ACP5QT_07520 [Brevinematia bacterium]
MNIGETNALKFFYYQLPKGNYEITGFYSVKRVLSGKATSYKKIKRSSFSINEGEITYIGSFNINIKRNVLQHIENVKFDTVDKYEELLEEYKKIEIQNLNQLKTKKELVEIILE